MGRPFYIQRVSRFVAENVMTPDGVKTIPSYRIVCRDAETDDLVVFALGQNSQREEMVDELSRAIRNGEHPLATWGKREVNSKTVGATDMYELEDATL